MRQVKAEILGLYWPGTSPLQADQSEGYVVLMHRSGYGSLPSCKGARDLFSQLGQLMERRMPV